MREERAGDGGGPATGDPGRVRRWALLVLLGGLVLLAAACHGGTHELTVTTTADGVDVVPGDGVCEVTAGAGDCSLRAAVDEANATPGADTVHLPPGTYALVLAGTDDTNAGGDLDVLGDTTIDAEAGAVVTTGTGEPVLDVHAARVITLDLDVRDGGGAGIRIAAGGSASLIRTSVTGHAGPGVAVAAGGELTALHTTIAGNAGGGLTSDGAATLGFVTVTGNGAHGVGGSGTATLDASIVADQSAGAPDCSGPVTTSLGHNLDGDGSCGLGDPTDQPVTDPALGPLAGTPAHHHPLATSPALDAVPTTDPADCGSGFAGFDQRDRPRPGGDGCDLGAVEAQPASLVLTVDTTTDRRDAVPGDGRCDDGQARCSLRAAVQEASATPGHDTISLAVATPRLSLPGIDEDLGAGGDLDVYDDLTLVGDGAVIDASGLAAGWVSCPSGDPVYPTIPCVESRADRTLHVHAGEVAIADVTITGGLSHSEATALLVDGGSVLLDRVAVTDHGTYHPDGVVVVAAGELVLRDSTLTDNAVPCSSSSGCSSAHVLTQRGGALELVQSTVLGNEGEVPALFCSGPSPVLCGTGTRTYRDTGIGRDGGTLSATASTLLRLDGTSTATTSLTGTAVDRCSATIDSGGHNVDRDGSCLDGSGVGDLPAAGPLLLTEPADHGGSVPASLPRPVSPVIDRIPLGTPGLCEGSTPADVRGVARPVGGGCDVGAVERAPVDDAPLTLWVNDWDADEPDAVPGDGLCRTVDHRCTLRAALDETNRNPTPTPNQIALESRTYPLLRAGDDEDGNATGDLDVLEDVVITGSAATYTTIDAGGLDRVLDVRDGASLGLERVTVTGGSLAASGAEGAGIRVVDGDLALTESSVEGNAIPAGGHGGGISMSAGSLSVVRSTVADNDAGDGASPLGTGGGLIVRSGTATITDSTISGNAARDGAGLHRWGGDVSISHTTFADNAGLKTLFALPDTVELTATIVDHPAPGRACWVGQVSGGWNVATDVTCGLDATGDVEAAAGPHTDDLAANGGGTATRLVHFPSPARHRIPAGTAGLCDGTGTHATDQAGVARAGSSPCSAGAVEGVSGELAPPTTFTVDDPGDTLDAFPGDLVCADAAGACTLRAAVQEANAYLTDDTIAIAPGLTTLSIARPGADEDEAATGDLDLQAPVTFEGGGATVDAAGLDRAFDVRADAVLRDVTITGGAVDDEGGGIRQDRGHLVLDRVQLVGNRVEGTGSVSGGGLHAGRIGYGAVLTVTDSLIADNTVSTTSTDTYDEAVGGGVGLDRIGAPDTARFDRTTISGNRATSSSVAARGGGIDADGRWALAIDRSTLSDNEASGTFAATGGAIASDSNVVALRASTLVGNRAAQGRGVAARFDKLSVQGTVLDHDGDRSCYNTTTFGTPTGDHNLVTDATCPLTGSGNQTAVDPVLGPLADNGGPTPTHLPLVGSPLAEVIPTGTPGLCDSVLEVDQRGLPRPQGARCDVGAAETDGGGAPAPLALVVDDPGDAVDVTPGDGSCATTGGTCTLRAAVMEANAWPPVDAITLGAGVHPVLALAGAGEDVGATGDLDVLDRVVLDGAGGTIDAAGLDRAIDAHVAVVVRDVTVTGGSADEGGGIRTSGDAALDRVTVTGSTATSSGGGVALVGGTTTVVDSTVTGNVAGAWGGGIAVAGGWATVAGSTISSNTAGGGASASGGGIGARSSGNGVIESVTVTDSIIDANVASATGSAGGGGLSDSTASEDALSIVRTTISGNEARSTAGTATGGGVVGAGTVTDSTITANRATSIDGQAEGGGLALLAQHTTVAGPAVVGTTIDANAAVSTTGVARGGGVLHDGASNLDTILATSTIEGNEATSAQAAAIGGGIAHVDGRLGIERSLVAANAARSSVQAPWGGGIAHWGHDLTVVASTLDANLAAGTFFSSGGAIAVGATTSGRTTTITATTIADGRAARGRGVWFDGATATQARLDGAILDHGGDKSCGNAVGLLGDHTIVSDATCTMTGTGNQLGVVPLLGALADHGGPTRTRLPQPGSPALDAVPVGTPGLCDGTVPTDQRGVPRPQGAACDVGAAEQ